MLKLLSSDYFLLIYSYQILMLIIIALVFSSVILPHTSFSQKLPFIFNAYIL